MKQGGTPGPKPEQHGHRNLKHKYVFSLFQQNPQIPVCRGRAPRITHANALEELGYCCWTAPRQCHIREEGARAPHNDPTDFTQGQDNLDRPRRTGLERPNCCSQLPRGWARNREALRGKAVRRALVVADVQTRSLFFFPPLGHLYQKMRASSPKIFW